jgi:branched-chain amino acid transport system substrate-binding protein
LLGKKIMFGLVLIVLLFLVLVFTLDFNSEGSKIIKIGVALPLSGDVSSWGDNALAGIKLATQEINSNGGIDGSKIELYVEDTKCSSESVNALNKLININDVDAIIGFVCSGAAKPALGIAQDNEVPLIIPIATAPGLASGGDFIFRVTPADDLQGKVAAEFIYNNMKKKTVAIIHEEDAWGKGLNKTFSQKFQELGGKILFSDSISADSTDFKSALLKAKSTNAELLFAPVLPKHSLTLLQDLDSLGAELPIFLGDGSVSDEVIADPLSEGLFLATPKFAWNSSFDAKIKSLQGYSNLDMTYVAPVAYDAAKVLYNAIDIAGTASQQIKSALRNTKYNGVSNYVEFDDEGELTKAAFEIRIIQNGESVVYN